MEIIFYMIVVCSGPALAFPLWRNAIAQGKLAVASTALSSEALRAGHSDAAASYATAAASHNISQAIYNGAALLAIISAGIILQLNFIRENILMLHK